MDVNSISTSSGFSLGSAVSRQLPPASQVNGGSRDNVGSVSSRSEDGSAAQSTGTVRISSRSVQLSDEEAAQLAKLQARDRQVRQHEMAHLAVSGGLATSGASFTYQKGPDGVNYAVGGEVSIDTSPGRTPEETIARAQQIQAAALAPADPSGQDRSVAAQAQQMEIDARAQLAAQAIPAASTSGQITDPSLSSKQQTSQVQQAYSAAAISSESSSRSAINTYA